MSKIKKQIEAIKKTTEEASKSKKTATKFLKDAGIIKDMGRPFTCSPFGEIVDLDADETYEYLPNTIKELDDMMFKEIGFAYCYMSYWHKDIFYNPKWNSGQPARVDKLIQIFTEGRKEQMMAKNIRWFQEQVFIFQDETENQC